MNDPMAQLTRRKNEAVANYQRQLDAAKIMMNEAAAEMNRASEEFKMQMASIGDEWKQEVNKRAA